MLDFTVAIRAKSMLMIVPAALRLKPTKTERNLSLHTLFSSMVMLSCRLSYTIDNKNQASETSPVRPCMPVQSRRTWQM